MKRGRRWKLRIWVTLITQTRGFWNIVIFHVWWQKVPVILYCYQGAITPWIHQWNNSQAPCPWNILSTGHTSLLRSPIYVREVDVVVERPELVPIRNLPGCLMLPWMIPELNSLLIFPCPILDKISRTSWLSLSLSLSRHPHHPELLKLSLVCYLGSLWFSIPGPRLERIWHIGWLDLLSVPGDCSSVPLGNVTNFLLNSSSSQHASQREVFWPHQWKWPRIHKGKEHVSWSATRLQYDGAEETSYSDLAKSSESKWFRSINFFYSLETMIQWGRRYLLLGQKSGVGTGTGCPQFFRGKIST